METELTKIYNCPSCRIETPHYVLARRGDRVGIQCSHCRTNSLVLSDTLSEHQYFWEEELRQILNSLESPETDDP